jgi:hypothetical protein
MNTKSATSSDILRTIVVLPDPEPPQIPMSLASGMDPA